MLHSTASNAQNSPLLSLPPEIRSRIWDYVFDVGVIHVTSPPASGHAYGLSICRRPEVYAETPPHVLLEDRDASSDYTSPPSYVKDHELCLGTGTREPFDRLHHLSLLRTCRLIYHEAVLKPFSVNGFQYNTYRIGPNSKSFLHRMIDTMVPMQARAIRRLHTVSVKGPFLSPVVVKQLKGLERLSIQIAPHHPRLQFILDRFIADPGVLSLSHLPLKSINIGFRVKADRMHSTDVNTVALITWLKDLEDKLLNGTMNAEDDDTGQVE